MHPAFNSIVAVPVSQNLYMRLATLFPESAALVVEQVLEDFLERTKVDYASNTSNPFMWDQLRLPSDTKVRTKYRGELKVAEIKDGRIYWGRQEFKSMSQLARAMRGNTSNNAWVVLEIQFPGKRDWILANRLRK